MGKRRLFNFVLLVLLFFFITGLAVSIDDSLVSSGGLAGSSAGGNIGPGGGTEDSYNPPIFAPTPPDDPSNTHKTDYDKGCTDEAQYVTIAKTSTGDCVNLVPKDDPESGSLPCEDDPDEPCTPRDPPGCPFSGACGYDDPDPSDPFFDVFVDGVGAGIGRVPVGETSEVDYTVWNTGDPGTDTVEFLVDGSFKDSKQYTLGNEEDVSGSFDWTPSSTGSYDVKLQTTVSEDVRSIDVVDPAFFDISILETNSPVGTGNVLQVMYKVENTGGFSDIQNLTLEIDGEKVYRRRIGLQKDEEYINLLEWYPGEDKTGSFTATTSTQDDLMAEIDHLFVHSTAEANVQS